MQWRFTYDTNLIFSWFHIHFSNINLRSKKPLELSNPMRWIKSCKHVAYQTSSLIFMCTFGAWCPKLNIFATYTTWFRLHKVRNCLVAGFASEILILWWCNNSHVLREHMGYGLAGLLSFMKNLTPYTSSILDLFEMIR